ncbi:MAG: PAS domain S-box protein, partial [Cyanobacteria bacterium P01_C01_bin.38]
MVQQLTVLIVDNHSEDCQRYESYLRQNSECDYTILSESTGNAALDLYHRLHPDLILLEYLLPDMDGLEFLAKLKQKQKQKQKQHQEIPPVIMITGCGNENIAVRAIKSGFQDYLVKQQVTAEILNCTVNSAILNSEEVKKDCYCSEERFRTSVENMLDCFGIFSSIRDEAGSIVDFRIDYMNAAACECNQMTKEQQLGKKLCEIFPSHRTTNLFQEYCQVVETNKPLVKESLIYTDVFGKQELTKAFDIRATKLGDGFVASWRDVTENREELRLSNERFQLASRAVDSVIYDWDITSNSIIRTEGITSILGYCLEEIEPTIEWWMRLVHPEDKSNLIKPLQAVLADREYYTFEYRVRHKNGEYCYVLDRGSVVRNGESRAVRVVGSITDITKQKQAQTALRESEAKYKRIIESNIVGIYFSDFTGRIYEANDAFLEIIGYNREDLDNGCVYWNQITPPEIESQEMIQKVKQELKSNGVCTPFEKQYFRKDGTRVSVLMAIACIEGKEAEGYSVCFVL